MKLEDSLDALLTLTNAIGTCLARRTLESSLTAWVTASERSLRGSAMGQSKGKRNEVRSEKLLTGREGILCQFARGL